MSVSLVSRVWANIMIIIYIDIIPLIILLIISVLLFFFFCLLLLFFFMRMHASFYFHFTRPISSMCEFKQMYSMPVKFSRYDQVVT